jgi:hypothetical protein
MVLPAALIHASTLKRRFHMAFKGGYVVDNRDAQEMFEYLEARVEIMKRRIQELERENETPEPPACPRCGATVPRKP